MTDTSPNRIQDLIEPVDKEELQSQVNSIMMLIDLAKNTRSEVYSFDPVRVRKEKAILKLQKKNKMIKRENKAIEEENKLLKKEIRVLENYYEKKSGSPKKKLKKPDDLVESLREFNKQAYEEIIKLSNELEADTYDYSINEQ